MEQARREQMETQGAKLAKEILRLQVELEDVGVHLWDQMGYDESATLTSRADEAYRAGEFDRALALYEEAKQKLVSMQASIPDVKAENMTAGDQAIKQGRSEDAIRAFTIVTAIDPEDSESRDKLALAENLDALLGKLGDAEYLEQEGKLREAEEALQSTLDMEPDWSPAKTALARVRDRIDQRRFNDAMSVALAALENEAFDEAREAFGKARDIRPESPEPADGLQQIEIAEQQRRIRELRSEAERQIGNENWDDAAGTFEEILEIDDALVFARQGHERATERHELDQTLERFIEQPTVMADDDELRAARRALSRAARIDDPGDRLSTQIDKLSHYISMARIPVEVELRSDGRTRVTVYRYGELGRLESHTIEVIPGQYTVVGKRPGYQDVERKLTVLGGRDMDPVYIACTEEI
ncbi:MAG: hypothetical protein U5O39_07730 [Gammaproteobacteria bacterium]|nr:hypothetical protein [Gammaproteobacteria bacterium]